MLLCKRGEKKSEPELVRNKATSTRRSDFPGRKKKLEKKRRKAARRSVKNAVSPPAASRGFAYRLGEFQGAPHVRRVEVRELLLFFVGGEEATGRPTRRRQRVQQ